MQCSYHILMKHVKYEFDYSINDKICLDLKINKLDGLTLDILAKELQMEQNLVKQFMTYWVHKGVIYEVKGTSNANINPFQKKSISFSGYFATNDPIDTGIMTKYIPVKVYDQISEEESIFIKETNKIHFFFIRLGFL